jgi:hypothetical protein
VLDRGAVLLHLPDAVEERLLGHDDLVLRVRDEVLDLLGRVGVVDGERRRTEVHRGGVDPVELGPVAQHDRDRVAAAEPEPGEAGGGLLDLLRVLGPGDAEVAALGADGVAIGVLARGRLERPAEGLLAQRRELCLVLLDGAALHPVPP